MTFVKKEMLGYLSMVGRYVIIRTTREFLNTREIISMNSTI